MTTKRLLFLLLFLPLAVFADPTTNAPSVTLAWDQHTSPDVVGYRLYWGAASRGYTNELNLAGVTNTTCSVSNLVRNTTYYFAATAYTAGGLESDYSAEVSFHTTPVPIPPRNLRATQERP